MRDADGLVVSRDVEEPEAHAGDGVPANDAPAEREGDAPAEREGDAPAEREGDAPAEFGADAADTAGGAGAAESQGGVDTEHVMNLTFVLTLIFGVPVVVLLSVIVPLDGWNEIITFVVQVGAAIWFVTAVSLYVRERRRS